ncbi:hypothetical protein ACFV6E_22420 [Streptomyces sp. NPDC059785]|uniref:hypothetical protein n=1 Tax=Streptomyces sp. NPDC059785 TaxID=3346945 RepID=UPI003651EF80
MSWSAVLPALFGAVIGALVTLLADRARWRRDVAFRSHQARRDAYTAYLAALHTGSEGVRAVVLGEDAAASRPQDAAEAFRSAGVYQARESLALLAPQAVADEAGRALHRLRDLRNLAADGHPAHSPEYRTALTRYDQSLTTLRTAMRRDIESER